jgi:hypothetical protein
MFILKQLMFENGHEGMMNEGMMNERTNKTTNNK